LREWSNIRQVKKLFFLNFSFKSRLQIGGVWGELPPRHGEGGLKKNNWSLLEFLFFIFCIFLLACGTVALDKH
jgi:hypothetical protein